MKNSLEVTKKELRQFGIMIGSFLVLFFGLVIPWKWGLNFPIWPWIAAVVFLGASLVLTIVLKLINVIWMKPSHVLGWINTKILLSIIFYLIFLPIGIIMRVVGKDPMHRKFDKNVTTYRIESKQPSVDHLEKPF